MFTWLYDLLMSLVYFVLGLFGIQKAQDQSQLLEGETTSDQTEQVTKDLVVETLPCHEDAL